MVKGQGRTSEGSRALFSLALGKLRGALHMEMGWDLYEDNVNGVMIPIEASFKQSFAVVDCLSEARARAAHVGLAIM